MPETLNNCIVLSGIFYSLNTVPFKNKKEPFNKYILYNLFKLIHFDKKSKSIL